jgi:hypothetical protein
MCIAAFGLSVFGNAPASIAFWIAVTGVVEHLLQELEAFPLLRDARHGLIDEHEQEVRGVLLGEFVEGPPAAAHFLERAVGLHRRLHFLIEQMKPFRSECEEDVVLAREVAIDGGGAIFNSLGDLADRDALIAFGHEQVARGAQNGGGNGLPFPVLAFFCAHESRNAAGRHPAWLNSVQTSNGVRRRGCLASSDFHNQGTRMS